MNSGTLLDLSRTSDRRDVSAPAPPAPLSEQTVLLQVISRAAQDPSIDLDRMERLLTMHKELNAQRAEREFHAAMARFKKTAPKILKDKHVHFDSKKEGASSTDYWHATLGAVCEAIVGGLGEVGISHHWDLDRKDARIFVTCVLTHEGGHSTRTMLDGPPDTTGNKNPMQQVSSTITLLQRYTLLAATGMGTHDDDDGRAGGGGETQRATEPAPEGYDNWHADMTALADNGLENLSAAWASEHSAKFRRYVIKFDEAWWNGLKAKAAAIDKGAQS